MTITELQSLFAYSRWATDCLLGACEALPEGEWSRDLGSSFPSLRDTFVHIVGADWAWLRRWQGDSPQAPPEWKATASAAELRTILEAVHRERSAFFGALTEADLSQVVRFRFLSGAQGAQPLGSLALHVVNHATYHRGQVVTMLRQLGVTPPPTDLYVFLLVTQQAANPPSA